MACFPGSGAARSCVAVPLWPALAYVRSLCHCDVQAGDGEVGD